MKPIVRIINDGYPISSISSGDLFAIMKELCEEYIGRYREVSMGTTGVLQAIERIATELLKRRH